MLGAVWTRHQASGRERKQGKPGVKGINSKHSLLRKHRGTPPPTPGPLCSPHPFWGMGATYPASELFPHSNTSAVPFLSK